MQVAKVCIVGCFAVSRSARIGLIVLALAIAVVGAGAVGMAFLPAAVLGFSLGQVSALAVSGMLSDEATFALV